MWHWMGGGFDWGFGMIVMAAFWLLFVAALVWIVRVVWVAPPHGKDPAGDPRRRSRSSSAGMLRARSIAPSSMRSARTSPDASRGIRSRAAARWTPGWRRRTAYAGSGIGWRPIRQEDPLPGATPLRATRIPRSSPARRWRPGPTRVWSRTLRRAGAPRSRSCPARPHRTARPHADRATAL